MAFAEDGCSLRRSARHTQASLGLERENGARTSFRDEVAQPVLAHLDAGVVADDEACGSEPESAQDVQEDAGNEQKGERDGPGRW